MVEHYRSAGNPFPNIFAALLWCQMAHRVMVIWEEVPENTKVFFLELEEADFKRVMNYHCKFINSTSITEEEEKDLFFLSEMLEKLEPSFDLVSGKGKTPLCTAGTFVVVAGFLM